jgi:hypothetical protein
MSVNFNLISTSLDDATHASIIDNVKTLEGMIPFAITLPPEEKAAMAGVGVRNIDFIVKTHEYAVKNPGMGPGYLDITEFGKDVTLAQQLRLIMDHLVPLLDKLSDTYALVASEAYSSARIFYHHVKNAASANVPGASAIAKELGKRFKTGKSASTGDETTDTGDSAAA